MRKHVKTYKHFAPEESKKESSDESPEQECFSPARDNSYPMEPVSPLRGFTYPNKTVPSPNVPYNALPMAETQLPAVGYVPQVTYVRPLKPLYPIRVPTHEMSYLEYSQMYEHAYRNHYSNSISYPVIRPDVEDKPYGYQEHNVGYENAKETEIINDYKNIDEVPLNLICSKRIDCNPMDDLVRIRDLPLDLSTKS